MAYNLTNFTAATNILDMSTNINDMSNGVFGIALLVTLFVIVFIVFKQNERDIKENLLFTSAITSFIAILMFYVGMINFIALSPVLLLLFGSVIMVMFSN